jgi:hypothetical protein
VPDSASDGLTEAVESADPEAVGVRSALGDAGGEGVGDPVAPAVAVRLTTAHYTTPSHRKIHGVGIEPDILARMTKGEEQTMYRSRSPGLKKPGEAEEVVMDEPLHRAVDALRGWKVFARRSAAAH